MKKHILVFGIILIFVFSSVPVTFGYNTKTSDGQIIVEDYYDDRHLYPEYYDSYSVDEIPENVKHYITNNEETIQDISNSKVINYEKTFEPLSGPMDSPWPMYCHDVRHTGRSPYSTTNNIGIEKWRVSLDTWIGGGPSIDKNGDIYIGSHTLYAIYPNSFKINNSYVYPFPIKKKWVFYYVPSPNTPSE